MSKILIKNACYPEDDVLKSGDILCEDGIVIALGNVPEPSDAEVVDASGDYIVPGFLDLHTHGAVGADANDADVEGLVRMSRFFASRGVTGFLISIMTDTDERILRSIKAAVEASVYSDGAELMGIHLEGPFLAREYAGAMPQNLLRTGDAAFVERCQDAAGGMIKTITVAPEVLCVTKIIPALKEMGIRVMLGHSNAVCAEAEAAIDAGAVGISHTFNAMRLFHQHEPGLMGAALMRSVYCEAICDGLHLHPDTVRMLLKLKGEDKVVAVTDSIMAAGLTDGEYRLGANRVIVRNGDAMLADKPVRAGSTLTMDRAFRNIMRFTGVSAVKAVKLTAGNAAALLGLNDRGKITVGMRADLTRLDNDFEVTGTWVCGRAARTDYRQTYERRS